MRIFEKKNVSLVGADVIDQAALPHRVCWTVRISYFTIPCHTNTNRNKYTNTNMDTNTRANVIDQAALPHRVCSTVRISYFTIPCHTNTNRKNIYKYKCGYKYKSKCNRSGSTPPPCVLDGQN